MLFLRDSSAGSINSCVFPRFRCFFFRILPPEASIPAFSRGFDAFSSGFFLRKHQFLRFPEVLMLFLQDSSSGSINSRIFSLFRCFFFRILPPEASIPAFSRGFDAFSSGFFLRKHQFLCFLAVSMLFFRILPPEASISAFSRGFDAFSSGFFLRKHRFPRFSPDSMPLLRASRQIGGSIINPSNSWT